MLHALATPRAFLFIGRLADLAALTAAAPHAPVFSDRPVHRPLLRPARTEPADPPSARPSD